MNELSELSKAIIKMQQALDEAEDAIHDAEGTLLDLKGGPVSTSRVEQLETLIRAIGLDPDMHYTGGDLDAIREGVEWLGIVGYKPMHKSAYKELLIEVQP